MYARQPIDNALYTVFEPKTDAGLELKDMSALGITTQRATWITWDRVTGAPLHNFISWNDNRGTPWAMSMNRSMRIKVRYYFFFPFTADFVLMAFAWPLTSITRCFWPQQCQFSSLCERPESHSSFFLLVWIRKTFFPLQAFSDKKVVYFEPAQIFFGSLFWTCSNLCQNFFFTSFLVGIVFIFFFFGRSCRQNIVFVDGNFFIS